MTITLHVLLIAMACQSALFLIVQLLVGNRTPHGFEAIREEMREELKSVRRYVDHSVSQAMVESQQRDADLRRYIDEALKEVRKLPEKVEEATIRAVRQVMEERADAKARQDAGEARSIMRGLRPKGEGHGT